jgi:DDE family transposase
MPQGPRKFHFAFEKTGLTRFGGLSLFQSFCQRFAIRHFLQLSVRWPDYDYRDYHPADLFLAHVFSIVAGLGRIENTQCLLHNGLIPPLLGLHEFPHRDTLRTFLRRFGPRDLRRLEAAHDKLRTALFQRLGLRFSATVDADTTTLLTYGSQEGVARGYVPKRPHTQGSYAPILSSEGRTGLSLGLELRAGNVPASRHASDFLEHLLDKLPSSIAATRTRLRLDGAFYDRAIIEPMEQARRGYVVVARMTPPLKQRMVAARYHGFAPGWEAAEFLYTPFDWKQEHRFVAVRRPAAVEPEEIQQRLFTFKRYTYHRALVTNLELTPAAVWRFYCHRASQELLLREFKESYAMAKIPTHRFGANAAYLEAILWAYDLVLAFQRLCLPKTIRRWNISTLRRELWWVPAEWIRRGHRNVLVLPARYPRQDLFLKIQRAIAKVRPLL